MLPTSLIIIRKRPSKGGYVCPESKFENLSFPVLRRKLCRCRYLTISICVFILCRSFNPSLCRLSPFLLPYVAVSRPCFSCRNLAQQAGPKESGQNKCNQRRPTEGWSYTKHYCCLDLMGLKSENEKRECEKKTIPLMFCMRLISLHCQKNYGVV